MLFTLLREEISSTVLRWVRVAARHYWWHTAAENQEPLTCWGPTHHQEHLTLRGIVLHTLEATSAPPQPGHGWVTSVGYYISNCIHSVSAKTSTNSKSSTLRTPWHEHCFNYGTKCSLVLYNFIVLCLGCCDKQVGAAHSKSPSHLLNTFD